LDFLEGLVTPAPEEKTEAVQTLELLTLLSTLLLIVSTSHLHELHDGNILFMEMMDNVRVRFAEHGLQTEVIMEMTETNQQRISTTVQLLATITGGTWTIQGSRYFTPNNGAGVDPPTPLDSGKLWVGSSGNLPVERAISGDITISNTGVAAIASGVIVNADINAAAAIDVSKLQTLTASRAVVTNSSGVLTVSSVTETELGYLSGATSNIQTQINAIAGAGTITGAITPYVTSDATASRAIISNPAGKFTVSNVTSTELGYLSGVTSALQTQLNAKQATITGAATSVTSSDLTASRILVSDGSGKISASSTASSEIANFFTGWIKTASGGSSTSTTTDGRWVYVDTGSTGSKTLSIIGYCDALADTYYLLRLESNSSASSSGGTLLIQRNFKTESNDGLINQYQVMFNTTVSDRYIIFKIDTSSGYPTGTTAYFGLTVMKQ
jgi:hypothetical protein